jgi:hypothetical protein
VQGLYGAMFAVAANSASVVASSIGAVIEAGLAVVPPGSRYAAAMRRGVKLGGGDLDDEAAVAALHAEYGHLRRVQAINHSALPARWIDPLHDSLATSIPGFAGARSSDLAARTLAISTAAVPTEAVAG